MMDFLFYVAIPLGGLLLAAGTIYVIADRSPR